MTRNRNRSSSVPDRSGRGAIAGDVGIAITVPGGTRS